MPNPKELAIQKLQKRLLAIKNRAKAILSKGILANDQKKQAEIMKKIKNV